MDRSVYHVVPHERGWDVKPEGSNAHGNHFDTKDEAVQFAKDRARGEQPSQVVVHDHAGKIEYESTYGSDPRRHPG